MPRKGHTEEPILEALRSTRSDSVRVYSFRMMRDTSGRQSVDVSPPSSLGSWVFALHVFLLEGLLFVVL